MQAPVPHHRPLSVASASRPRCASARRRVGRHGGLVLIGGEAGIGKTALAEALCREAEARGRLHSSGGATT